MEIWKDIKGFEGYYQASTLGRVRSVDRIVERALPGKKTRICHQHGRIIKPMNNTYKHRSNIKTRHGLALSKDGKVTHHQVHRLIALTFLDGDTSMEINHKDGNPLNNAVDNLEFVSRLENINHAFDNHLINTSYPVAKYDIETNELIEKYRSVSMAARSIDVSQGTLRFHLNKKQHIPYKGYYWEYLPRPVETIENTH